MTKTYYYTLPLFGYCIKGDVESLEELFQKFASWCCSKSIYRDGALGLWQAGTGNPEYPAINAHLLGLANKYKELLPVQEKGEWLDVTDQ